MELRIELWPKELFNNFSYFWISNQGCSLKKVWMPHQEDKTWTDSTHDPKKEWEKGATPKNLRDELSNAQTELWTVSLYGYLFYNTYSFWPGALLKAWCIFEMCQQIVGSFEKRGCRHVTSDQDRACSFNACSFKQSTNNIYLPPKSRTHFFWTFAILRPRL